MRRIPPEFRRQILSDLRNALHLLAKGKPVLDSDLASLLVPLALKPRSSRMKYSNSRHCLDPPIGDYVFFWQHRKACASGAERLTVRTLGLGIAPLVTIGPYSIAFLNPN
jgi:hypothetical protein